MRQKRKWAFTCPDTGIIGTAPWTPKEAAENGRAAYNDRYGCEICGPSQPKMRYVVGNQCVGCFTTAMHETFNLWCQGMPGRPDVFPTSVDAAHAMGVEWCFNHPNHPLVCTGGAHLRRTSIENGHCVECELIHEQQLAISRGPRAAARRAGLTSYLPNDPCVECGQVVPRSVVTNACTGCSTKRHSGPRAAARSAGLKRYVPDFDCPECGSRAERNVVTNACSGCNTRAKSTDAHVAAKPDGRRTPTSIMVDLCPDMIISREDARANGFTQYRTGEPCRRGHKGWRYVSVGTCIACARGDK